MRIIAGEHRGRLIGAPPGEATRPMLDRVREAMFSTLGERVHSASVLDLFAGSGSLSLEALSRGAQHARMVERASAALEVLKRNVAELGVAERTRIIRANALQPTAWHDEGTRKAALLSAEATGAAGFDLVFLDPPYAMLDDPKERARLLAAIETLLEHELRPGGMLVLHAPARAIEMLRFRSGGKSDLRRYGGSGLCYLSAAERAGDQAAIAPDRAAPAEDHAAHEEDRAVSAADREVRAEDRAAHAPDATATDGEDA